MKTLSVSPQCPLGSACSWLSPLGHSNLPLPSFRYWLGLGGWRWAAADGRRALNHTRSYSVTNARASARKMARGTLRAPLVLLLGVPVLAWANSWK